MDGTTVTIALAIWNVLLSAIGALIMFNVKAFTEEQKRVEILVNKTREEVARDYATKTDLDKVATHIDLRFNRLDEKLDKVMERVGARRSSDRED